MRYEFGMRGRRERRERRERGEVEERARTSGPDISEFAMKPASHAAFRRHKRWCACEKDTNRARKRLEHSGAINANV